MEGYILLVEFDGGERVLYDVKDDIINIDDFKELESQPELFKSVKVDSSRTCVYWNERIDLPSDTILEYGTKI